MIRVMIDSVRKNCSGAYYLAWETNSYPENSSFIIFPNKKYFSEYLDALKKRNISLRIVSDPQQIPETLRDAYGRYIVQGRIIKDKSELVGLCREKNLRFT